MNPRIAIIGGTGLYELFEDGTQKEIETPYGKPSEKVLVGFLNGKEVVFIPRHDKKHAIPPHAINHKANIFALNSLGVKNIIGTGAAGIINTNMALGDFIIPHDFLDFTKKTYTFFDKFENEPKHIDMTKPFSDKIRNLLIESCKELRCPFHEQGVYVNTSGPRFETPAEIRMLKMLGGDIVAMTNIPELILSNELGIEYASISVGTNYASGISKKFVSFKEMQNMMKEKEGQLKKIITKTIKKL